MMNKKKGFSLAELLIALLIISIVLSAAIPTITKKNTKSGEKTWRWAADNNNLYSAVGANQSIIIGAEDLPYKDESFYNADGGTSGNTSGANKTLDLKNFFYDSEIVLDSDMTKRFTTDGDKLVIIKPSFKGNAGIDSLINSHISFYNIEDPQLASGTKEVIYAGRLALDKHNMALGIGALQNNFPVESGKSAFSTSQFHGFNTALGHYALFHNNSGQYNTAVGEKSLTHNATGNFNTALGYYSLSNSGSSTISSNNTSVGAYSMQRYSEGDNNTALGYMALASSSGSIKGNNNTAIGSGACGNLNGNNNICIGYNAGASNESKDLSNGFYLGSDSNGIPFMYGNMDNDTSNASKTKQVRNLNVAVDVFQINKRINNYEQPIFIAASEQALGIAGASQNYYRFNFLTDNTPNAVKMLSIYATPQSGTSGGEIVLDTKGDPTKQESVRNLIISNKLFFTFPQTGLVKISGIGTGININDVAQFKTEDKKNVFSILYNGTSNQYDSLQIKVGDDGISTLNAPTGKLQLFNANNTIFLSNDSGSSQVMLDIDKINVKKDASIEGNLTLNSIKEGYSKDVAVNISSIWDQILVLNKSTGQYSDIRLKENITPNTSGLKEINALEVKNYTYKKDKEKTKHVGVIAQQLQKIFPNAVTKDKDGYLQIRQEDIFYAMVNSIKELFAKIQDLTAKITGLDKRLTELEKENAQLKKQNAEFEKRLSKLEKAKN